MKLNHMELEQFRSADLISCNPEDLVDLCDINIDTSLPRSERMASFLRQVGNPYLFKVDGLIVKAVYRPDARCRLCDAVCAVLTA